MGYPARYEVFRAPYLLRLCPFCLAISKTYAGSMELKGRLPQLILVHMDWTHNVTAHRRAPSVRLGLDTDILMLLKNQRGGHGFIHVGAISIPSCLEDEESSSFQGQLDRVSETHVMNNLARASTSNVNVGLSISTTSLRKVRLNALCV